MQFYSICVSHIFNQNLSQAHNNNKKRLPKPSTKKESKKIKFKVVYFTTHFTRHVKVDLSDDFATGILCSSSAGKEN